MTNIIQLNDLTKEFFTSQNSLFYAGFFDNLRSAHTKAAYMQDLLDFRKFLKAFHNNAPFTAITHELIIQYKVHLLENGPQGRPLSKSSVNRKLSCLKKFFIHLKVRQIIKEDPTELVELFKIDRVVKTRDLSHDEVSRLFAILEATSYTSALHRAIITVLFTTRMRRGALLSLKIENLIKVNDILCFRYIEKRDKVIITPLNAQCLDAVFDLLEWGTRCGHIYEKDDFIFRAKGLEKPLMPSVIRQVLKKYCSKIGITDGVTPHMARTTFIGELADKGVSLERIADCVGHSSIGMTLAYIKRKRGVEEHPVFRVVY